MTPLGNRSSGDRRVCPRCGSEATDSVWCAGCGLNLKKAGNLPTADEYSADEREKDWIAGQRVGRSASIPGAETAKRALQKRTKAKSASTTADKGQATERVPSSSGHRKRILAGPGLLFLVVAALAVWSESAADIPGIGKSPLASEESGGSSASTTNSTGSGDVFVTDNLNTPLSEPTTILYGNHLHFLNMKWERWGEEPTEGTGTVQTVDCSMSCAQGAPIEEPVRIQLSEIRSCGGESQYTSMHVASAHVGELDYPMTCDSGAVSEGDKASSAGDHDRASQAERHGARVVCGDRIEAGAVTSCDFAREVEKTFYASDSQVDPAILNVRSPVTNQTYEMRCNLSSPHRCTGGNDASVYFP